MITGLSHMTFIVEDLNRMSLVLEEVLGATLVYDSKDEYYSHSEERFYDLNGIWIAIMKDEKVPQSYNHIAFKVDKKDLKEYRTKIERLGLKIKEDRTRIEGEGASIYFYDFDNHLFELHSGTLQERLESYTVNQR